MTRPKVELVQLRKEYHDGAVVAVDGVDLAVTAGETMALLGPSGCGKSTLLNMIVGLESPTGGDILIDGQSVKDAPPSARNVGLVFQDYAVFTHMSVRQNLAFGLSVRGVARPEIQRRVGEIATLVGLADKLNAPTRNLSNSELQRVAIGRTLVTRPALLLLDEPLSNLEAADRLVMRRELRRLQQEIGLTVIYVTHDQIEALSLADRIAVMDSGRIRQVAASAEIYDRPDNVFVASFLGSPAMNMLRGHIGAVAGGLGFAQDGLTIRLPGAPASIREGAICILGIRPEALRVVAPTAAAIAGQVTAVELRGPEAVINVQAGLAQIRVITPAHGHPRMGETVGLDADPDSYVLFSGETGRRVAA